MSSILSNVIFIEEEDFQEYDYHPELTLHFIRHLYCAGDNFLMNTITENFPEKVILQHFMDQEYKDFCKLLDMDLENKNEILYYCREHLSIELMDLIFNTAYEKRRDDVLEKKISYSGQFESFKDCADWISTYVFCGKLCKCQNEIWYKQKNGKWITYEKEIKNRIQSVVLNGSFSIKFGEEKALKLNRMNTVKEIYDMIIVDLPADEQLKKTLWDQTKGKLNFTNGTYNFKTLEFSKRPHGTIYMINRPFNGISNPKSREELTNKVFRPIFNIRDDPQGIMKYKYFMYMSGRAIAGDIEDKILLMLSGNRNCGKGILSSLINNCIQDYSYAMDIGCFKEKGGSADPAKSNSWFVPLQFRRVALMNESSKVVLEGNKMKQFSSGGDPILARTNFKDEDTIYIQSSGIIFCNDIPKFDTNDVYKHIHQIALTSQFVKPGYAEEHKHHGISYYESDDTLKYEFINRPDILNEFLLMIIEAYGDHLEPPPCVLAERDEDINEHDIVRDGFRHVEGAKLSNAQFMNHITKLKLNKTQSDAKKLVKAVFGDLVVTNKGFGTYRGILGLITFEEEI